MFDKKELTELKDIVEENHKTLKFRIDNFDRSVTSVNSKISDFKEEIEPLKKLHQEFLIEKKELLDEFNIQTKDYEEYKKQIQEDMKNYIYSIGQNKDLLIKTITDNNELKEEIQSYKKEIKQYNQMKNDYSMIKKLLKKAELKERGLTNSENNIYKTYQELENKTLDNLSNKLNMKKNSVKVMCSKIRNKGYEIVLEVNKKTKIDY